MGTDGKVQRSTSSSMLKAVRSMRPLIEAIAGLVIVGLLFERHGMLKVYTSRLMMMEGIERLEQKEKCCGPGCRENLGRVAEFYDKSYFEYQQRMGLEKANSTDFSRIYRIQEGDVVADFGAGGAHILATLKTAGERIAVELNDYARSTYETVYPDVQITKYKFVEDVPDNHVDVFVSTSVIEHVECPLTELKEIYRKVKPGGRVVIGIKNEGVQFHREFKKADPDQHLYTWNGLLLGNLLTASGFIVDEMLPRKAERDKAQARWQPEDYSNYRAFVYHWGYAHKPELL